MSTPIEKLHARARAVRARAAVRRWELRQLDYAAGAWPRLERLFALSERAWILDDREVETLLARGCEPHEIGSAFEPPRTIFVIAKDDVPILDQAREIALRSSPELLLGQRLALLPFTTSR